MKKTTYARRIGLAFLLLATLFAAGCDQHGEGAAAEPFPVPNTEPMRFGAPIWHPDGDLLMAHHRPFDEEGQPIDSLAGVYTLRPDGSELQPFILCHRGCHFEVRDWAPSGEWVMAQGVGAWNGRLFRISYPEGTIVDISGTDGHHKSLPAISPDGQQVAYHRGFGGDWALMVMDLDGTNHHVVRELRWGFRDLAWGPLDNEVTLSLRHVRDDGSVFYDIGAIDTNNSSIRELAPPPTQPTWRQILDISWDKSRTHLLFTLSPTSQSEFEVWRLQVPYGSPLSYRRLADRAIGARWSPDGAQISYTRYSYNTADIPGYGEIWLMNADGSNKRQITQR